MACQANIIGLTGTNAHPLTAPTFGVENMLGTNPLVFGMPTDEAFPFTNDYATLIIQRGKAVSGAPNTATSNATEIPSSKRLRVNDKSLHVSACGALQFVTAGGMRFR